MTSTNHPEVKIRPPRDPGQQSGRDTSELVVAIDRNDRSRSSECAISRVFGVLERLEVKGAHHKQSADIIRLLMLTGCRHREICHLKRDMVRGNVLKLPDTKTGPREVYLSKKAVAIIKRQPRSKSGWLFLQQRYPNRPRNGVSEFWAEARKIADIEDGAFTTCATPTPAMR